ncbi:MAG: hypothetical protein ACRCXZ_10815 [Patescibacteria group bacterium]
MDEGKKSELQDRSKKRKEKAVSLLLAALSFVTYKTAGNIALQIVGEKVFHKYYSGEYREYDKSDLVSLETYLRNLEELSPKARSEIQKYIDLEKKLIQARSQNQTNVGDLEKDAYQQFVKINKEYLVSIENYLKILELKKDFNKIESNDTFYITPMQKSMIADSKASKAREKGDYFAQSKMQAISFLYSVHHGSTKNFFQVFQNATNPGQYFGDKNDFTQWLSVLVSRVNLFPGLTGVVSATAGTLTEFKESRDLTTYKGRNKDDFGNEIKADSFDILAYWSAASILLGYDILTLQLFYRIYKNREKINVTIDDSINSRIEVINQQISRLKNSTNK